MIVEITSQTVVNSVVVTSSNPDVISIIPPLPIVVRVDLKKDGIDGRDGINGTNGTNGIDGIDAVPAILDGGIIF